MKFKKYNRTISAVYNWKGDVRSGLPLEIGEAVQILEENGGKCLVFDYFDRDNLERMLPLTMHGLHPQNF